MNNLKRRIGILAVLCLVLSMLLLVAACSNNGGDSESSTDPTESSSEPTESSSQPDESSSEPDESSSEPDESSSEPDESSSEPAESSSEPEESSSEPVDTTEPPEVTPSADAVKITANVGSASAPESTELNGTNRVCYSYTADANGKLKITVVDGTNVTIVIHNVTTGKAGVAVKGVGYIEANAVAGNTYEVIISSSTAVTAKYYVTVE